ncbi:septum formation inhibitor Maf [Luteimonas yindakuii]|uniref:dTTP/UTP pyrophosphatase n=1 Tax=Luteimonas yindakuii TaxID=2565782 RepID=A0A4Z1RG80_9GAMM|nr:Maf family nucleotide pyrophosphatase [Luteimonas yindakuii]TKS53687.1 septum formation inhibitor Maf [Luteimonas yindakuii]
MLLLASKSPRRRELLGRLGVPFAVLDIDIPEVRTPGETPEAYVRRVARDKADAGWAVAPDGTSAVLASDTEVVLDDRVYGKPVDADDAAAMLRSLAGQTHEVLTAVALRSAAGTREVLVATTVTFDDLDDPAIAAYVATGEPMGKAGAYAIQGGAERFVTHLAGSYSGVMGLPLHATAQLLRAAGLMR